MNNICTHIFNFVTINCITLLNCHQSCFRNHQLQAYEPDNLSLHPLRYASLLFISSVFPLPLASVSMSLAVQTTSLPFLTQKRETPLYDSLCFTSQHVLARFIYHPEKYFTILSYAFSPNVQHVYFMCYFFTY